MPIRISVPVVQCSGEGGGEDRKTRAECEIELRAAVNGQSGQRAWWPIFILILITSHGCPKVDSLQHRRMRKDDKQVWHTEILLDKWKLPALIHFLYSQQNFVFWITFCPGAVFFCFLDHLLLLFPKHYINRMERRGEWLSLNLRPKKLLTWPHNSSDRPFNLINRLQITLIKSISRMDS